MSWFLYLIECADGSVYTGITTDVAARFDEHAAGKGARYTRSRKPRAVLASFPLADRSSASRAEYWVKQLSPKQKRELAAGTRTLESVLPVVAAVDAGAEDAAESAGGARTRANGGTRRGRTTVADAISVDTPVTTAADTGGSNGTSPKRGRTAAKVSTTRVNKAAKAAAKQIATPPATAAGSKAAAPKRSRAAVKTSSPDADPAAKAKSTRRATSTKNDAASPAAPAPAPKTKQTARAKQNRAAS
ncbi:GIY-YIG nuclease family protein [Burkholderia sp. 4701]|nr:GIY-YIG nuclease family protein [Burkholderia sp. 4701]MXN81540.1 GIY-YIG nuclease family protein [Burkholderia sp. 4812]